MFLSQAQLTLLSNLAENGHMDLLDVNIATVSSLVVRGLVVVNIARKTGEYSNVELSEVGEALASNFDVFIKLPPYKEVLGKTRKAKYGR